jgi:hypothetical protein|tara:strand:- start:3702 stop:3890 length:189 start_codon:yes stop_codon:yes gene_type:complete
MKEILSVFKRKGRQSPIVEYNDTFFTMEKIDQVEFLELIGKEIAAHRKNICNDMFELSKGKI